MTRWEKCAVFVVVYLTVFIFPVLELGISKQICYFKEYHYKVEFIEHKLSSKIHILY